MIYRILFHSLKLVLLGAFLLSLPQQAMAVTHTVIVGDNFFSPAQLTIAPGDTVRWTNAAGGNQHDVTSDTGAWVASETASSWDPFEVTFNDVGEFDYRCTVHPFSMQGTITVQNSQASAELSLLAVNAADGGYSPGDMLNVDATIQNSGDADSGAFTISYYASTDSNITAADHLLGSAQIANVAASATVNPQHMASVPDSVPAGEYFIGAILVFTDSNAADNVNFDASAVTFFGLVFINPGMNDAWVNLDTLGQGFFFNVFPTLKAIFIAWFTYDTEAPDQSVTAILGGPGQRWVTGFGLYEDGNTVLINMELTVGGIFNSPIPEVDQTQDYGTVTIVFRNCKLAQLTYDFPGLGLSGTIDLSRATNDNVQLCQDISAEIEAMQ